MRYANQALYDKESVLVPRKGTLNNVMYVDSKFWTVDTMFYTTPLIDNCMKYFFLFISKKDLAAMNMGSAVPSMTTTILNSMQIIILMMKPCKDLKTSLHLYSKRLKVIAKNPSTSPTSATLSFQS